jgi:Tol biopolymer transport system component
MLTVGLAAVPLVATAPPAAALMGPTERVNIVGGQEPDDDSSAPSLTPNGRYVAFASSAENLVPDDSNSSSDVFVIDRWNGEVERVSINNAGEEGDDESYLPSISANGCRVAFLSDSDYLDEAHDENGSTDAYVRDRCAGKTILVSVWDDETPSEYGVNADDTPHISADGDSVIFTTEDGTDEDWAEADLNYDYDVFVRVLSKGRTFRMSGPQGPVPGQGGGSEGALSADGKIAAFTTFGGGFREVFVRPVGMNTATRVSVDQAGAALTDPSYLPSISADGRYVAFVSASGAITPGDANNLDDVFVRDMGVPDATLPIPPGLPIRASVDMNGLDSNGVSTLPRLNNDGRTVVFMSTANDLVAGDGNGLIPDVFVRDLDANSTERVSMDPGGDDANGASSAPALNDDGSRVAFESDASDLVTGDLNGFTDIFVRGPEVTPPAISTSAPTAAWSLGRIVGTTWMSSDATGVARAETQLQPTKWNSAPAAWIPHRSNLPEDGSASYWGTYGRTYCFRARATDVLDNTSPFTAKRCTAIPLYSGNLAYSGTWSKYSPPNAFAKTARYTTQQGARMVRSGVVGEKLALIVTRCRTCGTVVVKLNGVTMKTYNLFAPTTQRQQVLQFASRAWPYKGTVSVEVTSRGKLVVIEGLGVYQD